MHLTSTILFSNSEDGTVQPRFEIGPLDKMKLSQSSRFGCSGVMRSLDFTLAKLMEEVGELAVEVQIVEQRLPLSKGGTDGLLGESVDIINVALDMAYLALQLTNSYSVEEMTKIIREVSNKKLIIWEKKFNDIIESSERNTN